MLLSSKWDVAGTEEDLDEVTNSFDVAGVFGLGYDFQQVNIGARYVAGFNDTWEADGISLNSKNNVAQIYIGYSF